MKYLQWIMPIIFVLFTGLLLNKGIALRSIGMHVDGAGIGIYFLGIEINDRVRTEQIPSYANGFFITGIITLLVSIVLFVKNLNRNKASN
ncbi:hypothetical protein [Chengkuizengella axinellae]|uniref:Uncharacterized protein n=1 Tax=Chengkuizengella axinellae TaxID=3064388 RepID=A0ABT9J485_9BACL|nr:hypothetical protein [Chengkuizengella sp. 2205SS18-9]MDP5276283.1 hypothetical protein [Chengkuizengella sp. 2205SS18-9]